MIRQSGGPTKQTKKKIEKKKASKTKTEIQIENKSIQIN